MPIYKREGSPYWQYDFKREGVRYKGSTRTADKRRAQQFERDLKRQAERGETKTTDNATVSDLLDRYYEDHARHMPSVDTLEFYIQSLQDRLPLALELSELSNPVIAEYVASRRKLVSPATVNREIATLRSAHRMAGEDWEWDTRAISWRRHMLKEPQGRTRWITEKEAGELLGALSDHISDAARWSLLTGCRKAETFGMQWDHVNLPERVARVFGKGQKWREVPLSASAFVLLANLPHKLDENGKPLPRDGAVFDATNLRKHWTAACTKAKIADFRWHDLRHTFATWLRQKGTPIEVVKESLGHADISTTMRYAHVAKQEIRDAVELITIAR